MRQLTQLVDGAAARRLAAVLRVEGIDAFADEEPGKWNVWVREEDQIAAARKVLNDFQANPNDPRFADAEKTAQQLYLQEEKRRELIRKNVVQVGDQWRGGSNLTAARIPITVALIAISVVVALLTGVGAKSRGAFGSAITFVDINQYIDFLTQEERRINSDPEFLALSESEQATSVWWIQRSAIWLNISQGQIWRLVTPIFLHFGLMHIIFNSIFTFQIGGLIELRKGIWFWCIFVLTSAILSNVGQAMWGTPNFGGMSGVGYGAFGYVWLSSVYNRRLGFNIPSSTVFIMMLWFFLCIAGEVPGLQQTFGRTFGNVANVAHAVGLLTGVVFAMVPVWYRKFMPGS